jgi:hypothetical protein
LQGMHRALHEPSMGRSIQKAGSDDDASLYLHIPLVCPSK